MNFKANSTIRRPCLFTILPKLSIVLWVNLHYGFIYGVGEDAAYIANRITATSSS